MGGDRPWEWRGHGVTAPWGLSREAGPLPAGCSPPGPEQTVPLDERLGQQRLFHLRQLAWAGEDEEGGGVPGVVHLQRGALQLGVVEEAVAGLLPPHGDLHGPALVQEELPQGGGPRVEGLCPLS